MNLRTFRQSFITGGGTKSSYSDLECHCPEYRTQLAIYRFLDGRGPGGHRQQDRRERPPSAAVLPGRPGNAGEPPASSSGACGGGVRLRPGLFEPLVLADLYPDMTARLVDGGVHDNQGISGLLEQDCTVLLVSDGSGQMDTKKDPSAGPLGVPLRANNILMARVRVAQYHEVDARRRSSITAGINVRASQRRDRGQATSLAGVSGSARPGRSQLRRTTP